MTVITVNGTEQKLQVDPTNTTTLGVTANNLSLPEQNLVAASLSAAHVPYMLMGLQYALVSRRWQQLLDKIFLPLKG